MTGLWVKEACNNFGTEGVSPSLCDSRTTALGLLRIDTLEASTHQRERCSSWKRKKQINGMQCEKVVRVLW